MAKKKKNSRKQQKKQKEQKVLRGYDQEIVVRRLGIPGEERTPAESVKEAYRNTQHLMQATMSEEVDHGRRVSSLAYEIAREMQFDDEFCRETVIAGFFHDIGKTVLKDEAIDDSTMVVEELNSVRQHPRKGCEMLRRHNYPERVCEAVLRHHECWDGSGYPGNLAGEAIPPMACILRVCDVFCSLTQNRPYRGAFDPETALRMMIEEVERFDIRVFLALQRVLHKSADGSVTVPEPAEEVRGVWKQL